jgi:hypothetical protein
VLVDDLAAVDVVGRAGLDPPSSLQAATGPSTRRATARAAAGEVGRRIRPHYSLDVFLGQDLLAYLVLAIGGAMAVGSIAAIVKPPAQRAEGDLERAPLGRSIAFAAIGLIGALWALISLIAG